MNHNPDIIRFNLRVTKGHVSEDFAAWDFGPNDEMRRALGWMFDPDDVRAFINKDMDVIAFRGGSKWLDDVGIIRSERRSAFQYVAGKLGDHILDGIEKKEGWL